MHIGLVNILKYSTVCNKRGMGGGGGGGTVEGISVVVVFVIFRLYEMLY